MLCKNGKYSPAKFANFVYICPEVVICPACNTIIYKICEFGRAIFPTFYNMSQPYFAVLLMLFLALVLDFVRPAEIKI